MFLCVCVVFLQGAILGGGYMAVTPGKHVMVCGSRWRVPLLLWREYPSNLCRVCDASV